MTSEKHLKARIRARMAKTGERYTAARCHVVGEPDKTLVTDQGYTLRGGLHPESANISNLLAHLGAPIAEAMVLGIGGGLGAGYILWEFAEPDMKVLTLGFRNRWNYLDWTTRTLDRLGATYTVSSTGGVKAASSALTTALAAGTPAIVVPDRQIIGYWHLPPHLDGYGGHQIVAYAQIRAGVRVDDRNLRPLTVDRALLDQARARVGSYKNHLWTVTAPPRRSDLRSAVRDGIADCVAHLGGDSSSFAVPAWRKWSRLLTDTSNDKGWPKVFASGGGLVGALLSIWEGVEPVGMTGGHLRDLYAEFLDSAAELLDLPALRDSAADFRVAGELWHAVAEAALPADVPEYARLRELIAAFAVGVVAGDDGAAERAEAAAELWELRAQYDHHPPAEPDFTELAARVAAVHEAERAAVDRLRAALP
jgi:hypothetical protein